MAQDRVPPPEVSAAASAMAKARLAKLGPKGRSELASKGGYASWANLSPEERRLEMRRRSLVRKKNRLKRAKVVRAARSSR